MSQSLLAAIGANAVPISKTVCHNGKHSYQVHISRHKAGGTHYYGTQLKPTNVAVAGCNHNNVDLNNILAAYTSAKLDMEKILIFLSSSRTKHNMRNVAFKQD